MSVNFDVLQGGASLARPPSPLALVVNRLFFGIATFAAFAIIALVAFILYEIGRQATPAIMQYGARFLVDQIWDVQKSQFGILPQIWGTLYSSLLALLIGGRRHHDRDFSDAGLPASSVRHKLSNPDRDARRHSERRLRSLGHFCRHPFLRPAAAWLHQNFGRSFLLDFAERSGSVAGGARARDHDFADGGGDLPGCDYLVPYKIKEAAYGMGTTRWEAILKVIVPTAAAGISSALVLGFGRALGETMALAMLIGNANQLSLSLFSPANTLAALLASNFPEAAQTERQALMYAALVLLAITLVVNVIGTLILVWTSRKMGKA